MLGFSPDDQNLILGHLEKFHPYLLAMSVFDSFSVDLSTRFESLLFPSVDKADELIPDASIENTQGISTTVPLHTDTSHSSISPSAAVMDRQLHIPAPPDTPVARNGLSR